jgi:carbon-monoxide dehydrogenase catalytic subunit
MAELELEKLSVDVAAQEMLKKAQAEGVETIFDRARTMKPCPIGAEGACCRICAQGPCRVPPPKKKPGEEGAEEKKQRMGLCGATAETIVARNFARMVAAGTAAHSDHSRGVAKLFKEIAHGEAPGYEIKDVAKLRRVARDWDVALTEGEGEEPKSRDKHAIAKDLAEKVLAEFGQQSGEINCVKRAPKKRQEVWRKAGVVPRGIDIEVVELMHRTHMGVDQDYRNLIKQSSRCALADGWGGSMISTDLQDIIFGCPVPIAGEINLGVLKEDHVNVVMHGHEPLLPEMLYVAAQDPELITYAQNKGAKGIQLAGMCCSANEVLMRHGVPVAGNYLHQELAVITGAVDALVVDVQCEMQALENVAACYHTKIVTTDDRAKMPLATHIPFDEHHALDVAKKIIRLAIDNYPNRKAPVLIPQSKSPTIVGFSYETIQYLLGGSIRGSYYTLNDNVINGRIRGVAGVVGCNNCRTTQDSSHLTMIKELLKNDVIVLSTGCAAMAAGKYGLLTPEAASKYCGPGLAEVCETVGIPPVLHMGACVDNSRILMAATACVKAGGLGTDISDLPAAGAAPEWMSEKAIAIGQYFVASGVYTVFGVTYPTTGSEILTDYLFKGIEEELGGKWDFEMDPELAAKKMIAHIDLKRKALGIDKARERVLYDMAMRRELEAAAGGEEH